MTEGPVLSDRDCRLIRHLCEGLDWDEACDREQVNSVDKVVEIRLWASPVSDRELNRLLGRKPKAKAAVTS